MRHLKRRKKLWFVVSAVLLFLIPLSLLIIRPKRPSPPTTKWQGAKLNEGKYIKDRATEAKAAPKAKWVSSAGIPVLVIDARDDAPVSGARAVVTSRRGQRPELYQSDSTGRFHLCGKTLPASVLIEKQGYRRMLFEFAEAGKRFEQKLVLPLLRSGPFRIKVVDSETFEPIAGATAELVRPENQKVAAVRKTNRSGEADLEVKEVVIKVRRADRISRAFQYFGLDLNVRADGYFPFFSTPAIERVWGGELRTGHERVLVTLEPELTVDGLVLSPQGMGVEGARVMWAWQVVRDLEQISLPGTITTTDKDGRFIWRGPRPVRGSIIVAVHPDFAPGYVRMERPAERNEEPVVVRLKEPGSVFVSVLDTEGNPIPSAKVKLRPLDVPRAWLHLSGPCLQHLYEGAPPWIGVTGADGSVFLKGLPVGKYAVNVQRRYYVPAEDNPAVVLVARNTSLSLVMKQGRTVQGIVVDADGNPIPKAKIRFYVKGTVVMAGLLQDDVIQEGWQLLKPRIEYDGKGRFVALGLPYRPVKAEAYGRGNTLGSDIIKPDQERAVITLSKRRPEQEETHDRAILALHVLWSEYAVDLQFMAVDFFLPGTAERVEHELVHVRRGKAKVKKAPVGTFDILVRSTRFRPYLAQNVTIPADKPLEVLLEHGRTIRVRMEAPARLRNLRVYDLQGRKLRSCIVEDGNISYVGPLSPDEYRFEARGPEGKVYTGFAFIPEAAAEPVPVAMVERR